MNSTLRQVLIGAASALLATVLLAEWQRRQAASLTRTAQNTQAL